MNPSHTAHDELLIVRAATADAHPADADLAEAQLAACEDCRALYADIAAIRLATTAGILRVPPRPRSFRIPADRLQELTQPGWRRWLGRLGAPRFDLLRPLATAVAGLGLAVMVIGSVLPAGSPAALDLNAEKGGAPALGSPQPAAAPSASLVTDRSGSYEAPTAGPSAAGTPDEHLGALGNPSSSPSAPPQVALPAIGPSGLAPAVLAIVLGMVLVVAGAVLLLLNTVARRLAGR